MGDLPEANATATVGSAADGDMMNLFLRIVGGKIIEARFKTFGCVAAIAASSVVTEMLKGKTIDEARQLTNQAVADALGGLSEAKLHCSVLAEDGIRAALEDYEKREDDRAGVDHPRSR
jgi:nitrogen fixation NifU-like protein